MAFLVDQLFLACSILYVLVELFYQLLFKPFKPLLPRTVYAAVSKLDSKQVEYAGLVLLQF